MNDPMKKIPFIISILFSSGLFAQGVYNNGAKIVIGTGVSVNISGTGGNYRNETNGTDGSIDLSGTLKIAGNLTNNVAGSDILGLTALGSKVELVGTAVQTIGGTTSAVFTFPDLTINNSSGIVFSKNVSVTGTMTFTNGLVDIGNNNFTYGASALIAGTPSSGSMIIATGTGQVIKDWTAIGTFTFPVGDQNLTPKYSPVTLSFTGGTFGAGANTGINLVNAPYSDPYIAVSYLNRYWNITQTGITAFSCDAAFNYDVSDVVGTESDIYAVRVNPAPVALYDPTNSGLHQLTTTGLTSFGTFTGALGQRTLNLTAYLEGLYNGGGVMRQAQGAAGNQFPGTTADQITVELHSAVAGQYATINYSAPSTNLSTAGQATVNVPATYSGSYYLTVKHRNSIETVSAAPVSFSGNVINYDFTTLASQAFGGNMKVIGGVPVIYGGDVNSDGIVDFRDMIPVDNLSSQAASGYLNEDANGDGLIDFKDMIIIDNNSSQAIGVIAP